MKKQLFFFLVFLCPIFLFSQNVEVLGGLIADSLDVQSGLIKNVADPISAQDAATKAYVDALEAKLAILSNILIDSCIIDFVYDIEGNKYMTVKIGNQIWMAENLRTTKYNDGTSIPLVTDNSAWGYLITPGYSWYDTTGTNYATYTQDTFGALYNYYVVADTNSLNVCPIGWHVPTDTEWTILTTTLGGETIAGYKMKETGLIHWVSPNGGATNESGFTGLPGGWRYSGGSFFVIGSFGYWWSSSEYNTADGWNRRLSYDNGGVAKLNHDKKSGYSVRCLRD